MPDAAAILAVLRQHLKVDFPVDALEQLARQAVGHSLAGLNRQAAQSDLHQEQQQRITTLLAENDKFFTALNETAVEVANIRSVSQFERLDTLARLVSLAQTASHTGNQS